MVELQTDYYAHAPEAIDGLDRIAEYLEESDIEPDLLELIKLRASQINGCGHCTELHFERLEELGEDSQRLSVLTAWDEVPYFSSREEAALAWTEEVTQISQEISESSYEKVHDEFSDEELVMITVAINFINFYNRLALCFRRPSDEEP
ncbi:carboxymuconolactone decarboxylase family protein [Haloglomus salinum]|jgi:AhpD family alkylhydroperoxidase|uniref:carboxymuconolactone decarboxylase family protein n=1 Tax=Haloglomus salinum TaxID=2962673 RepID=UPI0020C9B0F0|nr:carboxymuconolactone decarboxylase family protein [Haloglomus salinum]